MGYFLGGGVVLGGFHSGTFTDEDTMCVPFPTPLGAFSFEGTSAFLSGGFWVWVSASDCFDIP